ncbi:MAG: hypothetical protein ACR2PT_20795 [Endozoicomonas sp.]
MYPVSPQAVSPAQPVAPTAQAAGQTTDFRGLTIEARQADNTRKFNKSWAAWKEKDPVPLNNRLTEIQKQAPSLTGCPVTPEYVVNDANIRAMYQRIVRGQLDLKSGTCSSELLHHALAHAVRIGSVDVLKKCHDQGIALDFNLVCKFPAGQLTPEEMPVSQLNLMHIAVLAGHKEVAEYLDLLYPKLKLQRSELKCMLGERKPIFTATPLDLAAGLVVELSSKGEAARGRPEWLQIYSAAACCSLPKGRGDGDSTDRMIHLLQSLLFNDDQQAAKFCRITALQARETSFLPEAVLKILLPHMSTKLKDKPSFDEVAVAAYSDSKLHSALMSYCTLLDPRPQELDLKKYDAEFLMLIDNDKKFKLQLGIALHRQHPLADTALFNPTDAGWKTLAESGRPFTGRCRVIIEGHGNPVQVGHYSAKSLCRHVLRELTKRYGEKLPDNMTFVLNSCRTAATRREGENFFHLFAEELSKQKIQNAEVRGSNGYVWSGFGEDGSALGLCILAEGSNQAGWDVEVWQGPPESPQKMRGQKKIKGIESFNRVFDLVRIIEIREGKVQPSRLRDVQLKSSEGLYSLARV